jgi:hypothetical protein
MVDRLSVTEKQFGYAGVRDGRHTKAARKRAEPEEHARLSAALDDLEAAQAPGSAHAGTAAAAAKALELMGEQNKVLDEENGALKEEILLVKESLKDHLNMVQAILGEGVGAEEVEGEGDVRLLRHHEHEALKLLQGVMLELLDSLPEAEEAAMVAQMEYDGVAAPARARDAAAGPRSSRWPSRRWPPQKLRLWRATLPPSLP